MYSKTRALLIALLGAGMLVNCGKQQAPPSSSTAPAAPQGTASIIGKVLYTGKPISTAPIKMNAECQALHPNAPAKDESFVLNPNGTLRYAFVYVKEGVQGNYPPPSEPAVVDQHNCMYTPHVIGVQAGQPVDFKNSDDLLHNVHAVTKNNEAFNFAQVTKGAVDRRVFKNPEIMVQMKCDVHPWMSSYIGVVAHPFFAVTGEDGSFQIRNLPAGTYTLEVWHEKLGTQTQQVTIADGETKEVNFVFKQP